MTIELDEKSYIVGIWFSSCSETGNDVLMCVIAHPEKKGFFKGWSRTRYCNSPEIFNNDDKKNWYSFISREGQTEEYMIETMDTLHQASRMAYDYLDKIIVRGSLEKLMEMAPKHHWMNMQQVQ
jgi:hypothetical protein